MKYAFKGAFAQYIVDFIEQKRAFGYVYGETEYTLYKFEQFCEEHFPLETELNQDIALKWAEIRESESISYQLNRITAVRQLALYMNSVGVKAYVIPMGIHSKRTQKHRYKPHIYTEEELSAIFNAADSYEYVPASPAMHIVIPVFFRLIYCCGLRPIEARRLRVEDVCLKTGNIKILESKGHKDRLVVMSDDMLELAVKFHRKISFIYPNRTYFFANNRGNGMYSEPRSVSMFHDVLKKAGLYSKNRNGSFPRAYDLRHTFATHRLYQWLREGVNVNDCLDYLSEYMGHTKLSSTAYYIHLVPEFYPQMAKRGYECPASIVPNVAGVIS